MILGRFLAVLAALSLASAAGAIACSGATETAEGGVDSSTDTTMKDHATPDARDAHHAQDARDAHPAHDASDAADSGTDAACVEGGGSPVLTTLRITSKVDGSKVPLVPSFSPDVNDYYVRCATGTNALSVSLVASCGAESLLVEPKTTTPEPKEVIASVDVKENEAIVAVARQGSTSNEYWVRCLPHDFPALETDKYPEAGAPTPGYYMLGNFTSVGPSGGYAMILNSDGVPVWYYHEPSGGTSDVDDVVGNGTISYFPVVGLPIRVVQQSPFMLTIVRAPPGDHNDLHELQVLKNGHFLFFVNPNLTGVDLTGLSLPLGDGGGIPLGPNSNINDCQILEIDPSVDGGVDGGVFWSWTASDHFDPAKDCREPILAPPLADGGRVIDTYHCNSLDVDPANGNLLVSGRQMDSAFYIEKATGKVLWKIGGAPESLDHATYIPVTDPFFEQHDVRLQPGWSACAGGQISLFDDETQRAKHARGVLYDVVIGDGDGGCDGGGAEAGGSATVNWQYSGHTNTEACGSTRIQSDGSKVIGWGLQAEYLLTELDSAGNVVLEFRSVPGGGALPMESYRALKTPLTAFDLTVMRKTAGK
jgi:hypothetical protein